MNNQYVIIKTARMRKDMTKIQELKLLLNKMENITADDEYLKEVGFQSEWDNAIVDAICEVSNALNLEDEKYYIPK